jgi:hypothetical protein
LDLGFLPSYNEFFVLQIITVRSTAFEAADPSGGSGSVEVKMFLRQLIRLEEVDQLR